MTIQEVINRVLQYHPLCMGYRGCDEFKSGDPEDECTGIVTAMSPTINVIRKAAETNSNLIIVHEPTNYTSTDRPGWNEDFSNAVYAEKEKMLRDNGIAVWRDHDHMHMHCPDGIFTGVLKYMGWDQYAEADSSMGMYTHFLVSLPQPEALGSIMQRLKETIGLNGIRFIGPDDMQVKKLAVVGHLYPAESRSRNRKGLPKEYSVEIIRYFEEQGVDLILPGETIDWTVLAYVRDAVQLGQNKAVITLGHFNWEELGMRYAREWVEEITEKTVPVRYVPSEDMYHYYLG